MPKVFLLKELPARRQWILVISNFHIHRVRSRVHLSWSLQLRQSRVLASLREGKLSKITLRTITYPEVELY
jgi:hypothetical protein